MAAELRSLKNQLRVPETSTPSQPHIQQETMNKTRLSELMDSGPKPVSTSHGRVTYDYSYVINDLRKVAVLATIALLIEIVLSLTLNFGFANLLSSLSLSK
jgi:hypothetical protein